MTRKLTAGDRLRRDMNATLDRVARATNRPVQWDAADRIALDRACDAADRAEKLREQFDNELTGQARVTSLAKISAEIRALDRLSIEVTRRLNADLGKLATRIDTNKQRAAHRRWDIERRNQLAHEG